MHDFPSNSAKARARSEASEPRPTVERITSAEVERRKTGVGSQFKKTFINGTGKMALDYMLVDVIVPAIQQTIVDAFQGGIERLIKGESPRRRSSSYYRNSYEDVGHVNYQGMSTSTNRRPVTRTISQESKTRLEFDEIVIPNRQEAEEVLDQMFEFLSRYGVVRVGELYGMTGIQSSHTDMKWGWTSLQGARVGTVRGRGYVLDLPEPQPLSA